MGDADALLPYAYNAGVLPYTAGVLPYAHHTYAQTYVKPTVAYTKPLVTYKAPLNTYAGLTYPGYTGYAGIHHLGKREAEAEPEADSQVLLNTPYTTAGVYSYPKVCSGVYPKVYSGVYPKVYSGVYPHV